MHGKWALGLIALPLVALSALALHAQTTRSDQITFRIIVVSSAERARQLAEEVMRGADFEALARAESLDPSARQGGLIGPVALSELRDELQSALRGLSAGAVSDVLQIPTGFAIVRREGDAAAAGPQVRGVEVLALASEAGVRPTISVDGFSEVQTALGNLQKPPDWNQDLRTICDLGQQAVSRVETSLSQILSPSAPDRRAGFTPNEVMEGYISFGQMHAYSGDMSAAIEQFERADRLAESLSPAAAADLQQMLGVAHLHKAEIDNGILREPGDRCLLSWTAHAPLAATGDFDRAVGYFLGLLDKRPDDVEVRWLLNAAYMATGGYPSRVPPRYLIPPTVFDTTETVGRFVDVSARAGIDSFSSAGGVIVDDFDNDGRFDLLTSNFDSCGRMQLFHRREDGMFVDRTAQAGLGDQLGGLNLLQTDYDNDGCKDVLVMRGGWEVAQRRSLLHNNCDGTFTDVTAAAGLLTPVTSSQTAVWTDVDNDGRVDLFVGNEDAPAQLFHNQGNGTFVDIAQRAGVQRTSFAKAVAAADYDNDGFPDLYVSNYRGRNFLYRNNGDGTFSEVALSAGVPGADRGFPAWFFDYDNDGWDDLFVSSYYLSLDESARSYLKLPQNGSTMKLYRNTGDGGFLDVTAAANLDKVVMPMGSNFGDIDNDGFLDIYLGTGSPSYVALVPSMLLRNRDGKSFVDVTLSSGTGEMHKGHGVAFADLDNDGDEDIAFKVGGATPGDAHAFRLFENPGNGNGWLGLHLIGVRSNRAAFGARITVTVEDASGARRAIHRTVGSGGSFGASPLEQHVGLGKAARIVEVQIRWPASGTEQTFRDVAKNQVIEIREMDDHYSHLDRGPLPLGGARAR